MTQLFTHANSFPLILFLFYLNLYAQNGENNIGWIEIELTSICVQNFMKFHRETKELDTTKV